MGYQRIRWQQIQSKKLKRQQHAQSRQAYSHNTYDKDEYLPSMKADNRAVCPKSGRMKYRYPTLEKALRACQYAPDPQRPYFCKACRAFHTTSKSKDEYYEKARKGFFARTGTELKESARFDRVYALRNGQDCAKLGVKTGGKMAKVYYTRQITAAALVKLFEKLGVEPTGKVGVKISTGEAGNPHYLQPALIQDLVQKVNGKIIECNVAYAGGRNKTAEHLQTAKEHGFTEIAEVDIMDADGEMEIPVANGRILKKDLVGKNLANYDFIINLAHFKGHEMAGFGGVLKNQSIGFASANGKAYVHTCGKLSDPEGFMKAFESEEAAAQILPAQLDFLEAMAETATAVADYMKTKGDQRIVYIDVINNLSRDCDCAAEPEAPCMADIGIAASLDPVALDQAVLDLVKQADDEGEIAFLERVEAQQGEKILEFAEALGLGSREYELIEVED